MFEKMRTKITGEKTYDTLVTHTNPNSIVSEEFKTLRTNIHFAMANKANKTIMVTSTQSNEGKTTVITNIAISFADQGKKVLLVDADMRSPSLHQIFNLPNRVGFSNMLTDAKLSLRSVLNPAPHPNLSIMTTGPIPPNPAELIASERMDVLLEQLKGEYELILFDMPPIIPVTDAQIMAAKVDGTVFVLRNGISEKKELLKAKELLEYAQAVVIGAVLNGTNDKRRSKRGYYGYGNGYGQRAK